MSDGTSNEDSPHGVGGTQGGANNYSVPALELFAKKYNLFYNGDQLPYNTRLTSYAKLLRKNATKEERILWKFLRTLPIRVFRQRPIAQYIVDFYIPKLKIVIEIDGSQHFTSFGKMNDRMRTEVLQELGLTVVRFTNKEVFEEYPAVCNKIRNLLNL